MTRRKNGELVVAYSGGREGHIDPFGRVEFARSRDDGRSWSWPQVVMDTAIDDRDAGIVETAQGTLLINTFTSLAYEKIRRDAKGWEPSRLERWDAVTLATTPAERQKLLGAWMLRSTDGGLTWTAPYRVSLTTPHGPFSLQDGRLLHAGKLYGPDQGDSIGVTVSRDDGLTWQWLAGIPARPGDDPAQYHELHGVETADKRIVVHIRNHNPANDRETLQTESADGGKTWSIPRPIGVWGLPSHLLRLRDGRLLMSYSYRRAPRGNHARISEDHGRTWSAPIVLSDDGTGDLGYPSTVELPSGELLTLWYESKQPGTVVAKLTDASYSQLRLARWTLNA
jgi:sialidase-1